MSAAHQDKVSLIVVTTSVLLFVLILPVSKLPFDWPARVLCMLMGAGAISLWRSK